ncbi:MAG TPA: endonuclease Q family protein, partial [Candidatus Dojkabacteria bacterium]|nr:endonuclease Q family protein [Candidatus Dojkabacteria bacterium]
MELIVDLHLHSHYSRATSPQMNTEDLYFWGKIKGINVLGTGDFTHPQYFSELREKLEPAEPGLFKLKDKYSKEKDAGLPKNLRSQLFRFVLTVEISNIYSKNGRVRKMHNLIVAPSLEIAAELNERLARIGNLKADGRPILGLDSKELLRICLEISKDIVFIPAHIWTPWFSLFGSKSGFDTIKEAFEDLTPEIRIVETGLSSDPFMNWRLSQLDGLTLISNSDAHSPNKLGREANVLNTELHYQSITGTLKSNDRGFLGTIEFFPEEGRYHYDGHRLCKTCFSPAETKKLQG